MNKLTLTNESREALQSQPKDLDKWIAGLRSGNYTQHRGGMCGAIPNSACCLHVLEMEVGGIDWEDGILRGIPSELESITCFSAIRAEELKAIFEDELQTPVYWNDTLLLSFDQIATLLETGEVKW